MEELRLILLAIWLIIIGFIKFIELILGLIRDFGGAL